jgi:hypothetical protein
VGPERLLIYAGRVACPLRGEDVEIDRCFLCPRFCSLRRLRGDGQVIVCQPRWEPAWPLGAPGVPQ